MAAKNKPKNSRVTKNPMLSLDAVKELGGTEDDIKLLADLDDNSGSDYDNPDEDFDAEPIKKDEIRDFIKQLEFHKLRSASEGETDSKKPEKKKKLLVAKSVAEEAAPSDHSNIKPSVSTEKTSEEGKKKKKEKNKYKVQHDEITSTTKDPNVEYRAHIKAYQKRKYLLVKPGEYFDNQTIDGAEHGVDLSTETRQQLEDFAAKLLQDETAVYNKQKENTKRSDVKWMHTVLTSGTLADKNAALTVLIQESPLHGLAHLDTLINMAKKKGRRENEQATEALKEIFLTDLIPEDRKLYSFSQRPLCSLGADTSWNKDVMDRKLITWYFESQLKSRYADFVKVLQGLVHDTVLSTKQKSVNTIYKMLVNKPEQEKVLLSLLINKVGDPHYKLAATVSHLLTKLVEHHPNMKAVVVREVEYLLFRPNIADRAQYYSVCFLNQLRLSHDERELAAKLIHIYFSFFKAFVKKGEVDSKMMSALLSGVNRAFPYAKLEEEVLHNHLEHLYKIVHIVNFNTSVQALMLLFQVMDTSQTISERYYSALYKKLLDPALKTSSKQAVFLNLLFKSLKKDESERRMKAFIKRVLQVCSYQQPQFTCGALIMLSEVLRSKPGLLSVAHKEEESDDEEHFEDKLQEDGDEEEADFTTSNDASDRNLGNTKTMKRPTWVHRANLNHKSEKVNYDPFHRNPQYCHAENECMWELENLKQHFHPSVALYARQILKGDNIRYSGDPLQDFTLIRFLDRFVYKNPKNKDQVENKVFSQARKQIAPKGIKSIQVTSDQFLKLSENRVPADDMFLYRYFQKKATKGEKKLTEDDSDVESVTDAEFDEFLDKYEGQIDGNEEDFGMDFTSEFGKKKDLMNDDSEEDLDDDLSDEEIDLDNDDELARAFRAEMEGGSEEDNDDFADADEYEDKFGGDDLEDDDEPEFNEEDIEFSYQDDDFADFKPKAEKRKLDRNAPDTKNKKKRNDSGKETLSLAAEQFSSVLDDNSGSKLNMIGSDALANRDKADAKQLKWEIQRDRWIKGNNDRHSKGKRKQFSQKFSQKKKTFVAGKGSHKNSSGMQNINQKKFKGRKDHLLNCK